MPELIRKPIQTIKAADASTSSTPVPRSEASTPTTTVSEKADPETENKTTVNIIYFYLNTIIEILLNFYYYNMILLNYFKESDGKSKEIPMTTDKSDEIKSEEGTNVSPVVKIENELSEAQDEEKVSKIMNFIHKLNLY